MARSTADSTPLNNTTPNVTTLPAPPATLFEPVLGSLCSGCCGLDLGVLAALGRGRLAWCADPDPHIATILAARFPDVPNLGDIRAVDWSAVEPVDVVTAGFPCQDISSAGRRVGIEKGERSGVWTHVVEAIRLLHPKYAVVENVAALRWRNGGLDRVLGDLAEAGYDAIWRSVRASDVGAAHRRERVFLLAWRCDLFLPAGSGQGVADAVGARRDLQRPGREGAAGWANTAGRVAAIVADADGGRLPIGGHPDRASSRPSNPEWLCDADRLGSAAAHTDRLGCQSLQPPNTLRWSLPSRHHEATPGRRDRIDREEREVAADPARDRRQQRRPTPARQQGRSDAAVSHPWSISDRHRRRLVAADEPSDAPTPCADLNQVIVDWGIYAAAILRWERLLGRPAPVPTQPGRHGRPVLAPAFSEFLMGLPCGWVTSLPLPRTAQLRALGNGVVPQQAAYAVKLLLADLAELTRAPGLDLPSEGSIVGNSCCQGDHDTGRQCGRAA